MGRLILCAVGIVMAALLAVTMTACGGGNPATADSSPSVSAATASTPAARTAMVTTLAGKAGSAGSTDGTGVAARFDSPEGIACDDFANLYVADAHNCTIRQITPDGKVTTLAGKARAEGSADGRGAAARFFAPSGITRDSDGNLYVSDLDGQTIRKITPAGEVTTVAGQAGSAGSTDGRGAAARFNGPIVGARDAAGSLYISDYNNDTIRKITWGD
jgi:hypothetical protein